MLSQIVKVGADATGFNRAVAGVANATNKAFSSVGKEITNRFLGAFAASAIIDRITGFVTETVNYADTDKNPYTYNEFVTKNNNKILE